MPHAGYISTVFGKILRLQPILGFSASNVAPRLKFSNHKNMTKELKAQPAQTEQANRTPAPRDPEQSKTRILNAADAEFAAKGLAGTRVDEIALRAGINKRMLYSYFGNKEALWLLVLERAYESRRGAERHIDIAHMAPKEALATLVRFNFRYCREHPEFIALLNNENLHQASYLQRSDKVGKMHSPLLETLGELLQRGADEGVFRADVEPLQLYITIASLSYFYFSNIHTLSTVFGVDLKTPEQIAQREEHIVSVVLDFLRPAAPKALNE